MANSVALLVYFLLSLYFTIRKASLDGKYTEWSEWDHYSASYAEGKHTRRRTWTRPSPGVFGKTCLDKSLQWPSKLRRALGVIYIPKRTKKVLLGIYRTQIQPKI